MSFRVRVVNEGDMYLKVTAGEVTAVIRPGDQSSLLFEEGDTMEAVQRTEEEAIADMEELYAVEEPPVEGEEEPEAEAPAEGPAAEEPATEPEAEAPAEEPATEPEAEEEPATEPEAEEPAPEEEPPAA